MEDISNDSEPQNALFGDNDEGAGRATGGIIPDRTYTDSAHNNSPGNPKILDMLRLPLPSFCGYADVRTPKEFLEELKHFADCYQLTENQLLGQVIPLALKGPAARWHRFMKGSKALENLDAFTTSLLAEFGPANYHALIMKELEARTQHPDEPLSSFIQAIAGYYERVGGNYSEREKVQRVLSQMHPEYRRVLNGATFENLQSFASAAPRLQALLMQERMYRPPPPAYLCIEPSLAWKSYRGPITRGVDRLEVGGFTSQYQAPAPDNKYQGPDHDYPRLSVAAIDPFIHAHSPFTVKNHNGHRTAPYCNYATHPGERYIYANNEHNPPYADSGPPNKRIKWNSNAPQTIRNPGNTVFTPRPQMQYNRTSDTRYNGDIDNIAKYFRDKNRVKDFSPRGNNQTVSSPMTMRYANNVPQQQFNKGNYNTREPHFEKRMHSNKNSPTTLQAHQKNVNGRPQRT
jgi:hypothetical protein